MPTIPAMNRRVVTSMKDLHGNVVLETSMNDRTVFEPDGTVTKYRNNEDLQLVCGGMWNQTMSIGQNPSMLLSVCEACRRPSTSVFNRKTPTHGLCSRAAGFTCAGCGTFLCPSHAKHSADGTHRCARCHRKHAAWNLLTALFFKSED